MTRPTLTSVQKRAIGAKLMENYRTSGFSSQAKYATSIGISPSDFTNVARRKWEQNDRLLSTEKWLRIARIIRFEFSPRQRWVTAPTATYRHITTQLHLCQQHAQCVIFCDQAGIGKTHAVREYAETHAEAYYVNAGASPQKGAFIKALAQSIGIAAGKSTQEELLSDVIMYLKASKQPLIIVDEAGDLHNNTWLLLKRLYNELEFVCGIYLVGARGLRKRVDSGIRLRTNGFEEVYSRFGGRYSSVLPPDPKSKAQYIRREAELVATHNGLEDRAALNKLLSQTIDLRRVRREVIKTRHQR